jgi:hypothetical protein
MPVASSLTVPSAADFKTAFKQLLGGALAKLKPRLKNSAPGRPPKVCVRELLQGLVFHALQAGGTLTENLQIVTRKKLAASSLSERRQKLPWEIFADLMQGALKPKATPQKHPLAFYQKWRLVAMDGTQFSVSNTPQILGSLSKAASRRMKAAFAKIGTVILVELGIHNPLAAAIGKEGESEMVLAKTLISSLPEDSLLLADRLYGVPTFLVMLREHFAKVRGHFLVRVRSSLKPKLIEVLGDGSALVEARVSKSKEKILVREIRGRVRRPGGAWVEVRFWTSLLDCKECPAHELLALYARRWEQELMYKELKVDMRQADLLRSHTVETAAQEVAALILAHALLAEQRMSVARLAQKEVLRISFGKTLSHVRALWFVLEAAQGTLSSGDRAALIGQVMKLIAQTALPARRKRSCPRAVKQPVGSWPRLTKNTYSTGATEYQLTEISS